MGSMKSVKITWKTELNGAIRKLIKQEISNNDAIE